MIIFAG